MSNENNLFKLEEIENIKVLVTKATGEKCPRCWKIFPLEMKGRNNPIVAFFNNIVREFLQAVLPPQIASDFDNCCAD